MSEQWREEQLLCEELGLRGCSMNRCCNAFLIRDLMKENEDLKKENQKLKKGGKDESMLSHM